MAQPKPIVALQESGPGPAGADLSMSAGNQVSHKTSSRSNVRNEFKTVFKNTFRPCLGGKYSLAQKEESLQTILYSPLILGSEKLDSEG